MSDNIFFWPHSGRTQVWSCGGGTQSTAIAAMICSGQMPKPDLSVFIDTGYEQTTTLDYLHKVTIPELAKVGVVLHVARTANLGDNRFFNDNETLMLPAYHGTGKGSSFCSGRWKRDCINRWMRQRGVEQCDQWIGISTDEMRRVRPSRLLWARNAYPLVEMGISRTRCRAIVAEAGWPSPPRSSCWMCPNHTDKEWSEMKKDSPGDFARAVDAERFIHLIEPDSWLHKSMYPIGSVDFESPSLFGDESTGCMSGACFI